VGFSDRMKQRREEIGLSRTDLADKIGVTPAAIGNYETGVSHPKPDILYKIFEALNTDPNFLYQDEFKNLEQDELEEIYLNAKNELTELIYQSDLSLQQINELKGLVKIMENPNILDG
jgi:transcriptional regulator with XRE-family HTH domain